MKEGAFALFVALLARSVAMRTLVKEGMKPILRSATIKMAKIKKKFVASGAKAIMIMNFPGVAINVLIKYYAVYEVLYYSKLAYSTGYELINPLKKNLTPEEKEEANTIFRIISELDDDSFAFLLALPATAAIHFSNKENVKVKTSLGEDGKVNGSKWSFSMFGEKFKGSTSFDAKDTDGAKRKSGRSFNRKKFGHVWSNIKLSVNGTATKLLKTRINFANGKHNGKAAVFVGLVSMLILASMKHSQKETEESKTSEDDHVMNTDPIAPLVPEPKMGDTLGVYVYGLDESINESLRSMGISDQSTVTFDGAVVKLYSIVSWVLKNYDSITKEPVRGWARLSRQTTTTSGNHAIQRINFMQSARHLAAIVLHNDYSSDGASNRHDWFDDLVDIIKEVDDILDVDRRQYHFGSSHIFHDNESRIHPHAEHGNGERDSDRKIDEQDPMDHSKFSFNNIQDPSVDTSFSNAADLDADGLDTYLSRRQA